MSLKQSDTVLLQLMGSQAVAMPPTPAQHEALAHFSTQLSAGAVDETYRRFEFHQPLPAGLMAVAISECAKLCGEKTSVWRQALSTIMTDRSDGDLELEVSMQQSGLGRIDFAARCTAEGRHDVCLRKVQLLQQELQVVINERWPGCTYTEVDLEPGPGGIPVAVSALGTDVSALEPPEVQAQVKLLRFFHALSVGIANIATTDRGRRFCAALDAELDAQLGGLFADGHRWSAKLQTDGCTPEVLGEDLAQVEEQAAANEHRSRGCELLAVLGRLYERSHLLVAAEDV
eukprot:COSAG04_NODE_5253_length_1686_cov_0.974795_1_plen_287_part_10